jgi:hypothetical protein
MIAANTPPPNLLFVIGMPMLLLVLCMVIGYVFWIVIGKSKSE